MRLKGCREAVHLGRRPSSFRPSCQGMLSASPDGTRRLHLTWGPIPGSFPGSREGNGHQRPLVSRKRASTSLQGGSRVSGEERWCGLRARTPGKLDGCPGDSRQKRTGRGWGRGRQVRRRRTPGQLGRICLTSLHGTCCWHRRGLGELKEEGNESGDGSGRLKLFPCNSALGKLERRVEILGV